jgi:hypothetical protein
VVSDEHRSSGRSAGKTFAGDNVPVPLTCALRHKYHKPEQRSMSPAVGSPFFSSLPSLSLSPQVGYSCRPGPQIPPFSFAPFASVAFIAAMLFRFLFTTLLAALLVRAAPLQQSSPVQLAVLTDKVDKTEGLTPADIAMLDQVRTEALVALREARQVLDTPNFEQNALFHAFLNRETIGIL